ncbi:MAG TPA: aminotransferase class V-fold PLP-dependent enzyme [Gemmataceae bacterium]|nr:aminotransferase class V-fold PLP-dependent enzyme [Gemmataceae bacterium]
MSDIPALLGGQPVRPQGPPEWPGRDPDVTAAANAALVDGSWGRYEGAHVQQFETALAEMQQAPFALTCASGTLAIEIALRAIPVGPGDEVIVAAYDYESNFLCVHATGATPVLVDVAPNNWNIAPNQIAAAAGPNTKAIIVSHLHGGLVPMREVREIADGFRARLIEDAAQATGAMVDGKRAGSWGDFGILSFGGSKLLSAGRGGAILTHRNEFHQRMRLLLRRGYQQWAPLSVLQAALLLPQLAKLEERNATRSANVERLKSLLADLPGWRFFENSIPDSQPAYYKLGVQFDAQAFGLPRERFLEAVQAEGIALDSGFRSVHVGRSPARFREASRLTEAERAHHGAVVLHHPILLETPTAMAEIAQAVRKIYVNADRLGRQDGRPNPRPRKDPAL